MCYDFVLLDLFCPHSELSNGVFWVFVVCVVFEKIEENRRSEIAHSVIIVHKCILKFGHFTVCLSVIMSAPCTIYIIIFFLLHLQRNKVLLAEHCRGSTPALRQFSISFPASANTFLSKCLTVSFLTIFLTLPLPFALSTS